MSKSLKLEIDVSMCESIDALKDLRVIDNIVNEVNNILEKNGQKTSNNSIIKSCKNAVSLLSSKKKQTSPNLLVIYWPKNVVESIQDTVVPNVSSDDEVSETNTDNDLDLQSLSPVSDRSHITFSICNNVLNAEASFEYLLDYFNHSLSMNTKPMNIEKILFVD